MVSLGNTPVTNECTYSSSKAESSDLALSVRVVDLALAFLEGNLEDDDGSDVGCDLEAAGASEVDGGTLDNH
jgi:hypothetical protein